MQKLTADFIPLTRDTKQADTRLGPALGGGTAQAWFGVQGYVSSNAVLAACPVSASPSDVGAVKDAWFYC